MIKRFRSYKGKLSTKDKDFFCIEGTHLLEEFINSNRTPLKIIATNKWLIKNEWIQKHINTSLITIVSKEVLSSAISTKNPDGVAALAEKYSNNKFVVKKNDNFILVLDRIQDPGNLGTLFRTALAGGVNKILLNGGANPLSQKVLRASCGSIFHLPFIRLEGDEEETIIKLLGYLENMAIKGFQVVITSGEKEKINRTIKPYWELDWLKPTVLILGNEGLGVHPKIKDAFNEIITIPHSELVESLNVACVAVPLLLERKRVTYTSNIEK